MALRCGELAMQHLFQFANRSQIGETGFAEIDLIAIFECAQQFHSIKRAEV